MNIIKRIIRGIYFRLPIHDHTYNIQHRLALMEATLKRIELATAGRDNSLRSGERIVATDIKDVIPSHRVRYELAFGKAKNAARILDIACGVGYGSKMVSKENERAQIVSVDISEEAISFAKTHYSAPNIKYICGDDTAIKDEAPFDLVICFETIEHVEHDQEFLANLVAKMAKGATIYLSTPNEEVIPVQSGNHFHYRHYIYSSLVKTLNEQGLQVNSTWNQASDDEFELRKGHEGMYIIIEATKI